MLTLCAWNCSLQLRFAMKSYSFIRENAYKVIYPWNKDDTSGIVLLDDDIHNHVD